MTAVSVHAYNCRLLLLLSAKDDIVYGPTADGKLYRPIGDVLWLFVCPSGQHRS